MKILTLLLAAVIGAAAAARAEDKCVYADTGNAMNDLNTITEYFNAGNRAMNAQDYDLAAKSYSEFIDCEDVQLRLRLKTTVSMDDIEETLFDAESRLGTAYYFKKQFDKAVEANTAALKRDEMFPLSAYQFATTYYNRAGSYGELGQKEKAIADLKKAVYYGSAGAAAYLKSKYSADYTPERAFKEGSKIEKVTFSTEPYGAAELAYNGGTLVVNNSSGQDGYFPSELGSRSDFTLSVTLKLTAGSPTSGNGIFFRGRPGKDKFGLLFNVTNDGRLAYYIAPKDPLDYGSYTFYPFVEGQTSGKAANSAVKIGGPNKLTVQAVGDFVKLSVNNKEVATVPWEFYPSGQVGVFLSGGNTVEYSDFKLENLTLKYPK